MMQWETLLSLRRAGDSNKRIRKEQDETRLGFEVDYDRVIFSRYFRSLQDKTQVIPLSKTDFVHTRLTHSLEVSVVGRSLGRMVGNKLLAKHPYLSEIHGFRFNDFGAIVAAAALAHDIGNPPFGHSGEKAIGHFFESGFGKRFQNALSEKEFEDLARFEGNAHGFHLLTASRPGVPGGLRLSYATLGAFMKYPKESLPVKPNTHVESKKFGFFQQDAGTFAAIGKELGLIRRDGSGETAFSRHPLTYLVEAADDICYTIVDFEDGINLGLIPEDYALEFLIKLVKDKINTEKYRAIPSMADRLGYLRALAISSLIEDASKIFLREEENLLQGKLEKPLLDLSSYKAQIDDILQISVERIYRSQEVIEKEIAGYRILSDILEVVCTAGTNVLKGQATSFDRLVMEVLPEGSRALESDTVYHALLKASSFVAGLSDGVAVHLHNKFSGKQL